MMRVGVVCLLLVWLAAAVANAAEYHRYHGCIHVHTRYSDGSGEFADIAAAAQKTGLDYVITTDHNTLQPLKEGHERYWDKPLILVSIEISTDAGHCLAFDLPPTFEAGTHEPQAVIDRVKAAGGFAILAHPMSPRWLWKEWSVQGYIGIEIANVSSLFDDDLLTANDGGRIMGRSLARLIHLGELYSKDPDQVMAEVCNNVVTPEREKWDELLKAGRQVVGIGSVDAHARVPIGKKVFKVPTYSEAFESVQSYVLTLAPLSGDVKQDREQIYGAIRNGRLYIVFPRVAPAPAFEFTAREGEREAIMGQPLRLEREARLAVRAPGHPHPVIRLLRDGTEIAHAEGDRLDVTTTKPGVYRVEVYAAEGSEPLLAAQGEPNTVGDLLRSQPRRIKPWIFANPIYLND